jgi:hypothetical protein
MPSGLTGTSGAYSATATSIILSGGTLGATYTIPNHVTFTSGKELTRTLAITIVEK